MARRKRILFMVDAVSLAQVVRLRELAAGLDPEHHEVLFASSAFEPMIFEGTGFAQHRIASMSPARMHRRLSMGMRPYDTRTLAGYVRQELALLERLSPDLIVSDLRLSLCISAPKLGIPHAALINAYWNPPQGAAAFPMPEHPLINLIGPQRVAPHFQQGLSFVLEHFAAPVNTLRRRHGLPPVGHLIEVLTSGDRVLYPDVPQLTPVEPLPTHHHFLGPVLWAPRTGLPPWWDALSEDDAARPLVYVTLGSSGGMRAARIAIEALSTLPVRVMLATAGRFRVDALHDNVHVAEYLPGDLAARCARLVVCNGGSSTAYQALSEGKPVIGLPFNMDQYLSMSAIERAGAGRLLRSGSVTVDEVRGAVAQLLDDAAVHDAARRAQGALRALDAHSEFSRVVFHA